MYDDIAACNACFNLIKFLALYFNLYYLTSLFPYNKSKLPYQCIRQGKTTFRTVPNDLKRLLSSFKLFAYSIFTVFNKLHTVIFF